MIDRTLESVNRLVAELRRDVDALEKRPMCAGKKTPGQPQPPNMVSYGFVYGIRKSTKGVHRITLAGIEDELVRLPGGTDMFTLSADVTSQQSVFTINDGSNWRLVDLSMKRVGGRMPMPDRNGQPDIQTWYHQPSYVGTYNGGRRFAVVIQQRWASDRYIVCVDIETGTVLAELPGNSVGSQRLDARACDSSPLCVRETPSGDGFEVYIAKEGKFEKQYEFKFADQRMSGALWEGAYFTGLFLIKGGFRQPVKHFDAKTGAQVSLGGLDSDWDRKLIYENGFFTGPTGISISLGGMPLFNPDRRPTSANGKILGHYAEVRDDHAVIYAASGVPVFTTKNVPGYNGSDWIILFDNHFAV